MRDALRNAGLCVLVTGVVVWEEDRLHDRREGRGVRQEHERPDTGDMQGMSECSDTAVE